MEFRLPKEGYKQARKMLRREQIEYIESLKCIDLK